MNIFVARNYRSARGLMKAAVVGLKYALPAKLYL